MSTVAVPSFEEYLGHLARLSVHADPTMSTPEADRIRTASASLARLEEVTLDSLTTWVSGHAADADVLALTVGLTQEKRNTNLKAHFGTSGLLTLARTRARELVEWLDAEFGLLESLLRQRDRTYGFGDILVARAGSRVTAQAAGASGRRLEDQIEAIALDLGLTVRTRTRFTGRHGRHAPCDLLVVDEAGTHHIAVAAKGFDSTGSKLTDAVREIEDMSDVREPRQYVMAVIDGIGWKNRQADLRRIHRLWETRRIDGMFTMGTLADFRRELLRAARRLDLLAEADRSPDPATGRVAEEGAVAGFPAHEPDASRVRE